MEEKEEEKPCCTQNLMTQQSLSGLLSCALFYTIPEFFFLFQASQVLSAEDARGDGEPMRAAQR